MKPNEQRQVVRIRRKLREMQIQLETIELESRLSATCGEDTHYHWQAFVREFSRLYETLDIARSLLLNGIREYGGPGLILPPGWEKRWEGAENAPTERGATSE